MMDQHLLANLLAWSAQVLCLAALGALLPVLLRMEAPGVRHAYYRVLLALCLALPWLQGRHDTVPGGGAVVTDSMTASAVAVTAGAPGEAASTGFPWLTVVAIVLLAGTLARLTWIAVGLWRLRRLRSAGYEAQGERTWVEALVGARAEIRYVPGLKQPVTFGALRPVVLLPETLRSQSVQFARSVLCHELLHVRRRDWVWLLLEEGVRAVLWFHPGVWWLISAVQRTREEVVDGLAVRLTGSRRAYAEALAAFADEIPVVPAAAFGRRRHLARRLRLIAREDGSSSVRLALSCAAMAVLVPVSGWLATRTFPMRVSAQELVLTEMGPLERQARPITPENPLPRRVYSVDPRYPVEAAGVVQRATVTLMITVDALGRVAEVRNVGSMVSEPQTIASIDSAGRMTIRSPLGTPPGSDGPVVVFQQLDVLDVTLGLQVADALVESAARAVRLWQFDAPADPPIAIRVSFTFEPDEVRLSSYTAASGAPRVQLGGGAQSGADAQPSRVPGVGSPSGRAGAIEPSVAAEAGLAPIRVGGNVRPPTKTKDVAPIYPVEAQNARVQGIVILEAVIGPDGRVAAAKVLRSVPLLDQAALDAVRQWEFTPTLLNGAPVPVIMTVTVQFTLSEPEQPLPPR